MAKSAGKSPCHLDPQNLGPRADVRETGVVFALGPRSVLVLWWAVRHCGGIPSACQSNSRG